MLTIARNTAPNDCINQRIRHVIIPKERNNVIDHAVVLLSLKPIPSDLELDDWMQLAQKRINHKDASKLEEIIAYCPLSGTVVSLAEVARNPSTYFQIRGVELMPSDDHAPNPTISCINLKHLPKEFSIFYRKARKKLLAPEDGKIPKQFRCDGPNKYEQLADSLGITKIK